MQLFLIESRTARLVAQARQATERFLTEEVADERELAFVEAFALARDPPLRPTVQDLEHYSAQWAPLVTQSARVRAAIAYRLSEKYDFTYDAVPGIRGALTLDEPRVHQAYERLYGKPLESIYAARAGGRQRLRWAWKAFAVRLENLSPFWTAYSLTLTETVGATILALPIAVAAIGPLPGVAILVVLGLVNVLTVAFMAEAVARSGAMRYGSAFLGRLVAEFLGRSGVLVLTASLFAICMLVLPVFYIGFARTLEDATGVPDLAWVALLFLVGLYYLRRQSLNATIASALVVGATSISLIVVLSLLTLLQTRRENLLYNDVPFVGGRPFEASLVALVFGVILGAYFGHMSVAICGRLVLRRDPSGRSLIWGSAAAQGTAVLVYSLFVLAVGGALGPDRLIGESGTVLSPLADEVGPIVDVLGSVFVILALGMASITFALALFNLTRERLPARASRVITLPRRRARLLFRDRGFFDGADRMRLALVYLGLDDGRPRFRLDVARSGRTHQVEEVASQQWEVVGPDRVSTLPARLPDVRRYRGRVALEMLAADPHSVRFRVTSTMRVSYEGGWHVSGLSLGDVLDLSDAEAEVVAWMLREGEVGLLEVAAHTGRDEPGARAMLAALIERGTVAETGSAGEARYTARVAARRGRLPGELARALSDGAAEHIAVPDEQSYSFGLRERMRNTLLGTRGRFAVAVSPVVVAFLIAEWLVLTDSGSFAGLLSFVGVVAVSVLAGAFPVLLLRSSRRKGDYVPATVYGLLGNPVLLLAIYIFFVASIFVHGLVIWDDLPQRAGALLVGVVILSVTGAMVRHGAFAPRVNVELREDGSEGRARLSVTAAGRPVSSEVLLEYAHGKRRVGAAGGEIPDFPSLRRATLEPKAKEEEAVPEALKVWAHRVTPEGDSEALPARLRVGLGDEIREFDLDATGGQTLQLFDGNCQVEITLRGAGSSESDEPTSL